MSDVPQIDGVTGLTEIGRGGFGVVYRGTEVEFGRDVAVKVLMPSLDDRAVKRFGRERRAMGAVSNHPNIVTVYRGGVTEAQQPYLVMEYVEGGSLSDHLAQVGPLDWRTAAEIGATLADALADAHRAGILHRDVKPGNIFQTAAGEPKLGDFGIARLNDGQETRTGSITASVAHAPPEIIDGQRGDERSDLYSLASTVYALTIGAAPFSRNSEQGVAALLKRIANDDPPALHLESAAEQFESTLRRALSKRPADRHATVAEFGNELRRSAATPLVQAQPIAQVETEAPPTNLTAPAATRKTGMGQLATLGLLALLIAGFGGWAVARAVFGNDAEQTVQASATPVPAATAAADPTQSIEPTPIPATPTPRPRLEPTVRPTAAPQPTTERQPSAAPTPTSVGGGERGSGLGSTNAGFTRVNDFSGAITVEVPNAWAGEIHDSSEFSVDDVGSNTRVLAVGGTLQALSGDAEIRDLTVSGIYVFAARLDGPLDSGFLLDGSLEFWADCELGVRSQILLTDGNADYQAIECARSDGDSTGVVALMLVPESDTDVGVSIFVQLAQDDDLDALETLLGTFRIDPSKIPAADA